MPGTAATPATATPTTPALPATPTTTATTATTAAPLGFFEKLRSILPFKAAAPAAAAAPADAVDAQQKKGFFENLFSSSSSDKVWFGGKTKKRHNKIKSGKGKSKGKSNKK
jgi:Tfp pilus assembly protein FimV